MLTPHFAASLAALVPSQPALNTSVRLALGLFVLTLGNFNSAIQPVCLYGHTKLTDCNTQV